MRKLLLFGLFSCLTTQAIANIGPKGFTSFKNRYFVETGTSSGGAVAKALKSGFLEVRSIEFNEIQYQNAVKRFRNKKQVKLYRGDSATDLWGMIQDIEEPATFWLDAHVYPPKQGEKNCPLIEELEQIKRHPIKTHTILIDDLHCCNSESFDFLSLEEIVSKVLEINPDYEISYIAGGDKGEYKNNILVAKITN